MSLLGGLGIVSGGIGLVDKLFGSSAKRQEKANMRLAEYNNKSQRQLLADSARLTKSGMQNAGISTAALTGGSFNTAAAPQAAPVDGSNFDISQAAQAAYNDLLNATSVQADSANKTADADLKRSQKDYQDAQNFYADATFKTTLDNMKKSGDLTDAEYKTAMQQYDYFNLVKDYRKRIESSNADINDTNKQIADIDLQIRGIQKDMSDTELKIAQKTLNAFDKRLKAELDKIDAEIDKLRSDGKLSFEEAKTEKFKRSSLAADAALKEIQGDNIKTLTPKQRDLLESEKQKNVAQHNLAYYQGENQRIKNKYQEDLSQLEVGNEFMDIGGKAKSTFSKKSGKQYYNIKKKVTRWRNKSK
nr:unnamed protein product [uncultured bacterium]